MLNELMYWEVLSFIHLYSPSEIAETNLRKLTSLAQVVRMFAGAYISIYRYLSSAKICNV